MDSSGFQTPGDYPSALTRFHDQIETKVFNKEFNSVTQ